jgi:galactitol-specific phosphotransferase system IIB component
VPLAITTPHPDYQKLGVKAEVTHTDFASMRGMKADLIVGQPMHTDEVPKSAAKAIVSITNLVDVEAAVKRITPALKKLGYIK